MLGGVVRTEHFYRQREGGTRTFFKKWIISGKVTLPQGEGPIRQLASLVLTRKFQTGSFQSPLLGNAVRAGIPSSLGSAQGTPFLLNTSNLILPKLQSLDGIGNVPQSLHSVSGIRRAPPSEFQSWKKVCFRTEVILETV